MAHADDRHFHIVLLAGVIVLAGFFVLNSHLAAQVRQLQSQAAQQPAPMMGARMSRMSFSEFDKEKAREMMDKDGDGTCDSCGMAIAMCIEGGMMQCSMDPEATMGVLGSQHIHADWKIYINGEPFDWAPYADRHHQQMMGDTSIDDTSAFIHIHPAEPLEEGGDVLHMHASGVPLGLFFESLGMRLDKDCLALPGNERYCGDGKNTLKFSVNGKPHDGYGAYVFSDLDKILISYGPADEDVSGQLASITSFAEAH